MINLRLSSDFALANAAAFFVMATGAVNWALPFGAFLWFTLTLTLVANAFIAPALLLKHRHIGPFEMRTTIGILAGGCLAYALLRSLLGMTAAPWSISTMLSHMMLVPAAVAVIYFAVLAGALVANDHLRLPLLRK